MIILLNFIFTGLHGYQMMSGLSTNKQEYRLLLFKDGNTCCTNPSLSNAYFWQCIKGLKNKIHTAVKTFLKFSIRSKCRGPKLELRFCSF